MSIKKEIKDRIRKLYGIIEYYMMVSKIKKMSCWRGKDSPDKIFYIISGTHLKLRGLFGDVNVVMRYINYALHRGYIPVVDFKHMTNGMIDDYEVGKVNGWETIFEQPTSYSLEEALCGKNRIFVDCHGNGSIECKERLEVPWDVDWNDPESVSYWIQVISHIKIKSNIMEMIDEKYKKCFLPSDRVLGVKIRGTDYIGNRPYGHPIQPDPDIVIKRVKEVMKEKNCNKIFLGCEDRMIQKKFKEIFGNKLLTGDIAYSWGRVKKNTYLYDIYQKNKINKYENNVEYLTNVIFLSRCTCLIASQNSALTAIRLWARQRGGYEYEYIYELGHYGIDD